MIYVPLILRPEEIYNVKDRGGDHNSPLSIPPPLPEEGHSPQAS